MVLWGKEGCLGDPMGPTGWFDESSDDSKCMYVCLYIRDSDFSSGRVGSRPEVVQEVLADLKMSSTD